MVGDAADRYGSPMSEGSMSAPACRRATRLQLLSKVGMLAGMLEYDEVLAAVARLSIPELADWCIVDVVENGEVRRAEVAHRDPARAALAAQVRQLSPAACHRYASWQALLSGRSLLVGDSTEEVLREQAGSTVCLGLAREVELRSLLVVPLVVRGTVVAVMTFATTVESGRRYGPEDQSLAEELAQRAAQLVENARLHQQLKQSEERFRVALAHTHVAVFEKDRDLRLRWIYNPGFGLDPANGIGKTGADLVPEDAAHLTAQQRAILETGEPSRREQRVVIGGEARHFVSHLEPLRDASGAIVGVTGAVADITEQKRAQESLADALAFREQVMGILGHDLRNPLSAMRVLASLLLRRPDLPEGAREQLAELDRAGRRMLEMIGTLLDFSESRFKGSLPVEPVAVDLHEVARGVVEELLAANPGRAVHRALLGDGHGRWDPARMAQVLSNLVGNALRHGMRDEPVRLSLDGNGEELVLTVTNHGAPIPPEIAPVLFEPFRRGPHGSDASHARGVGLGLYIAKQIVNAHGGEIRLTSTSEGETTFAVRLPRGTCFDLARSETAPSQGETLSP